MLLESGADPTVTDARGLTSADVAKTKKTRNLLRNALVNVKQQKMDQLSLSPLKAPARFGECVLLM